MHIRLTPELEQYVDGRIACGAFSSASEVVIAALQHLQTQDRAARARTDALRDAVDTGLTQMRRGEITDGGEGFADLRARRQRNPTFEVDAREAIDTSIDSGSLATALAVLDPPADLVRLALDAGTAVDVDADRIEAWMQWWWWQPLARLDGRRPALVCAAEPAAVRSALREVLAEPPTDAYG